MKIINNPQEMQQLILSHKREGKRIAFVPTMGYLHEGHASLLRKGRAEGDLLVLSIFVNPTQFGVNEDLDRYPRNMEGDCELARDCGVDLLFAPTASEMYPVGFQTAVTVQEISRPLCGASRPGHFDGVAIVVTKLFNIVQPDVAFFGKKDFQQLAVIRQMTSDLNLPVKIVGMPIVRERDGLAMSSRNAYLSNGERKSALSLSRAIRTVRDLYDRGEENADTLRNMAVEVIASEPSAHIDYVELRDSITLEETFTASDTTLMALAVKIGNTRLIDNTVLGEEF